MQLTDSKLKKAIAYVKKDQVRRFGNNILYDLCKKYPDHTAPEKIIAKALIIGRVYAAALERGKAGEGEKGDQFYEKVVSEVFKKFFKKEETKKLVDRLKKNGQIDETAILTLHADFVNDLKKLREVRKTSFASKYLHFHFPDCYFLYDSRAKSSLPILTKFLSRQVSAVVFKRQGKSTPEYERFFRRCRELHGELIRRGFGNLCLRDFDSLLMYLHEKYRGK